ncbi:threonine kinase [Thermomonospora umbrina]|uniref:Threonine kinase n=1 Tax=Thermomonospora umbrina TaxID=111806 RepID=A0A3D9T420_9ACTN|nr:threonine kinase [Thermomonospora umbrina]
MTAVVRTGTGHAPAHHGELLQGVFHDADGRLRRALVTLPHPGGPGSRAIFHPDRSGRVEARGREKVRRAALLALGEFSPYPPGERGGRVHLTSDVPPGIGMGSSTSDVTAAIRAVADAHVITPGPIDVARLAVLAEGASDPVMIDGVVLFAQREGRILETLGPSLPPMVVIGCDTRSGGAGIDTLALPPPHYTEREIRAFASLRTALRRAVDRGDPLLVGRVASASARLNQRHLPNPRLSALLALCRSHGGCGVQIAHSGTVAGLIFDPRRPGTPRNVRRCAARLTEQGLTITAVLDL